MDKSRMMSKALRDKKSFPQQLMDDLQRWLNPTDKKVRKQVDKAIKG